MGVWNVLAVLSELLRTLSEAVAEVFPEPRTRSALGQAKGAQAELELNVAQPHLLWSWPNRWSPVNLWGIRADQGVLKQLRINWNPNKKLLAPCFIKSLCFSARLCSRNLNKKQDQQFTDFAFLTIFYCREICKRVPFCRKLTINRLRWSSILFGGTPPIPCYFERGGWVAPSKPKFK